MGTWDDLAMTRCAVRQPRLLLIGQRSQGRDVPIDPVVSLKVGKGIRHLGCWHEVFFRIAVASEAPRHLHCHGLIGHWHLIDPSMAAYTRHAAIYVGAVIKINVIGNACDLFPGNRTMELSAISDRLQHFGIRPNLGVAGHAGLRWGNTRVGRRIDARVTISTVDAQI